MFLLRNKKTTNYWRDTHSYLNLGIRLDISCESFASKWFTWNVKSYFIWKITITINRMSTATKLVRALRFKSAVNLRSWTSRNCLVICSGMTESGISRRNSFNNPATASMSLSSSKFASPCRSKLVFNFSTILALPFTLKIPSTPRPEIKRNSRG